MHNTTSNSKSNATPRPNIWPIALSIALVLLAGWGSASATELAAKDPPHDTALGKLSDGCTVLKGARFDIGVGGMKILEGYVKMSESHGMVIDKALVHKGEVGVAIDKEQLRISLVQCRKTKKWVATNGVLYLKDEELYFLNGHTVRVIGGADDPFRIGGKSLSNVVVKITNGRPVTVSGGESGKK